jgi:hypothetical protein
MSSDDHHIVPDQMYAPKQGAKLEGVSLALFYQRMAAGQYGAVYKDGRLTRIPGSGILARRRQRLMRAKFKVPSPQPNRFNTIA